MNTGSGATIARGQYDAVIFDLDGVITRTAKLHARAWKALFDEYLERLGTMQGRTYAPFDMGTDYPLYVDGKLRYDGVKSFLKSRHIDLPYGHSSDPPTAETVCGLGNRKNMRFLELLKHEGVEVYESSIALVRALRTAGFKTAVVSSSKNCVPILESAHALDLFDAKVDGTDAEYLGLKGKPAPDIFLAAAKALDVEPARAVVVEDAIAGVQAGRAGGFGLVVGVDRGHQAGMLLASGADLVVTDLGALKISD